MSEMFIIDWHSVFVVGAWVSVGVLIGLGILAIACVLIGKGFQRRQEDRERDFNRAVAETPDEVFLDAIRKYEGA